MKKTRVLLRTTMDVSALTSAAQHLPFSVTAVSDPEERYRVDAKSIMGLLSLDLSTPVELRWESDSKEKEEKFLNSISKLTRNAEEWDESRA